MRLLLLLLMVPAISYGQLEVHHFDNLPADSAHKVVFIHTEWCGICQRMENTTFKDDQVMSMLNESFVFVELDGEGKADIEYHGRTFKYKPAGANTGTHELATALGAIDGKLNYPTLTILNTRNEIVFQHGGLMDAKEMLAVLTELMSD